MYRSGREGNCQYFQWAAWYSLDAAILLDWQRLQLNAAEPRAILDLHGLDT